MLDWYDRNAERYDRLESGRPGDTDFYVGLARSVAQPVLELGCGTGRVALRIARAGVEVVGLDRSEKMLAVARLKAEGVVGISFVRADMRSFALSRRFGLVCIPFHSFAHLLTDDDQLQSLRRCRDHLLPDGRLVLDLPNWPHALDSLINDRSGIARAADGGGTSLRHTRAYPGRHVRRVSVERMAELLRDAGFVVESLHGGFHGEPFDPAATPEQVWIARPAGHQASASG